MYLFRGGSLERLGPPDDDDTRENNSRVTIEPPRGSGAKKKKKTKTKNKRDREKIGGTTALVCAVPRVVYIYVRVYDVDGEAAAMR